MVLKPVCFLFARAIIWLLSLGRNGCIFNLALLSLSSLCLTVCYMFLLWVDEVPSVKRQKLEDPLVVVR